VTKAGKPTILDQDAKKKKAISKRKNEDDTPRAFARLMAYQTTGRKIPSGLDDGNTKKQSKKRKREAIAVDPTEHNTKPEGTVPKIQPGERMSEFAARVDAALPVSGLIGKGQKGVKDPLGLKRKQTKLEKRMQRMQKEWREVEAKRQERVEEAKEEAEEEDEGVGGRMSAGQVLGREKSKTGKKRKVLGEEGGDDDDPWAAVNAARNEQSNGLVGIHDVVQAPPQFTKVPKERFRVENGAKIDVADVPSTAGSLRRREELGEARRNIVEGYRKMMQGKRKEGIVS